MVFFRRYITTVLRNVYKIRKKNNSDDWQSFVNKMIYLNSVNWLK